MNDQTSCLATPFNDEDERLAALESAGIGRDAARAIAEIDVTMQRIRRGISKREFASALVMSLGPDIELQHLDAMGAIANWGHPSQDNEVTVGLVAERLNIDPSRASRLVSEIVDRGYAKRVASQEDARRICLELTDEGRRFTEQFRIRKWQMLARAMSTWKEDEIIIFARLLDRFSHWGRDGLALLTDEQTPPGNGK